MTDAKAPPMTKLSELVGRLRQQVVICKGGTFKIDMHDGRGPQDVTNRDIVRIRNPDGPEAADAIERLERENAETIEIIREIIGNANEAMPLGPFDCIDNHGEPYQSEALRKALSRGRAYLARASLSPSVEKGER